MKNSWRMTSPANLVRSNSEISVNAPKAAALSIFGATLNDTLVWIESLNF